MSRIVPLLLAAAHGLSATADIRRAEQSVWGPGAHLPSRAPEAHPSPSSSGSDLDRAPGPSGEGREGKGGGQLGMDLAESREKNRNRVRNQTGRQQKRWRGNVEGTLTLSERKCCQTETTCKSCKITMVHFLCRSYSARDWLLSLIKKKTAIIREKFNTIFFFKLPFSFKQERE